MLREDIQNALKEAMKSKNVLETNAIRMIIAGQKEKDVDARGKGKEKAEDAELFAMMQTMIKQRRESIEMFIKGGRPELAQKEEAEIKIIERFLPKQLSQQEVENAVKAAIKKTGAESMKDMGKVMGILRAEYAGQMDFGAVSSLIKSLLG
ncbi:MAG: GatB/YqeY domain-containing protein [Alphaproteobacteria bacterium]|nr:GatB/YqeY domain-containing protein [Alphaproteobacteria bacterium]